MAPSPVHEQPQHQLLRLAEAARARGASFEEFWIEAVRPALPQVMVTHAAPPAGAVRWPTDPRERKAWRKAIVTTREGWRRAYERLEPRAEERALAELSSEFELLGRIAAVRQAEELAADAMLARQPLPSAA